MTNIYFWGKIISPSFQKSNQSSHQPISFSRCDKIIQRIECGAENAFILTQNNQLYAFGSNQHGQLGLSFNPHRFIQISRILLPTKRKIVAISCGWYHTLILDQIGDLFSTGQGEQGAIGTGSKQNSYEFQFIFDKVKKISAGRDHSLAIKGNKVFGWGNTQQGQLNLHSKKRYLSPFELNVYPCQQIFAGAKFSIFNTIKGVFVCGINNNYQLGLGHQKDLHYAKNLKFQEQITKVWGGNYSFAKNKNNQVYIWGTGSFGIYKYPTKISFFSGSQQISLGHNFGMFLKNDKIYVWGSNKHGQLASQNIQSKDYAFESQKLTTLKLESFCCGNNFAIGINYLKKQFLPAESKRIHAEDKIRENMELDEQFYDDSDSKNGKQSFYSSFQYSPTFSNQTKLLKQQAKSSKNQKNSNFIQLSLNRNKSNKFGKHNCSNSQKQKSISDQTVKKMMLNYSLKKSVNCLQNQNVRKIDQLADQLNELKFQIHQKSNRNRHLSQQNVQLKQIIKQQLLKKVIQENQLNQSQIESNLRRKVKSQQSEINGLKKEYLFLNNMIQNNGFLRNFLGLKDQRIQFQQEIANKNYSSDQFGQKLSKLKKIIQQVVEKQQKCEASTYYRLNQAFQT